LRVQAEALVLLQTLARASGSIEPPESNSLALRLPAVARGALWETEVPSLAEPVWRPLGWPTGCSPEPLALPVPLLPFSCFRPRCLASAATKQSMTARPGG
jgi:hypothetical protein